MEDKDEDEEKRVRESYTYKTLKKKSSGNDNVHSRK